MSYLPTWTFRCSCSWLSYFLTNLYYSHVVIQCLRSMLIINFHGWIVTYCLCETKDHYSHSDMLFWAQYLNIKKVFEDIYQKWIVQLGSKYCSTYIEKLPESITASNQVFVFFIRLWLSLVGHYQILQFNVWWLRSFLKYHHSIWTLIFLGWSCSSVKNVRNTYASSSLTGHGKNWTAAIFSNNSA